MRNAHRLARVLGLALALVVAALPSRPAVAEPGSISPEEWQYLQRVKLIGDVNQTLWKALEDQGGWNAGLAGYARDATRLGARNLAASGAPAPALVGFHRQFVELLRLTSSFYDALARSNFGDAHEIGEQIRIQMLDFASSWEGLQERYQ